MQSEFCYNDFHSIMFLLTKCGSFSLYLNTRIIKHDMGTLRIELLSYVPFLLNGIKLQLLPSRFTLHHIPKRYFHLHAI